MLLESPQTGPNGLRKRARITILLLLVVLAGVGIGSWLGFGRNGSEGSSLIESSDNETHLNPGDLDPPVYTTSFYLDAQPSSEFQSADYFKSRFMNITKFNESDVRIISFSADYQTSFVSLVIVGTENEAKLIELLNTNALRDEGISISTNVHPISVSADKIDFGSIVDVDDKTEIPDRDLTVSIKAISESSSLSLEEIKFTSGSVFTVTKPTSFPVTLSEEASAVVSIGVVSREAGIHSGKATLIFGDGQTRDVLLVVQLKLKPEGPTGSWSFCPKLPVVIGEVSSVVYDDHIYIIGESPREKPEDAKKTFRLNLKTNVWDSSLAERPFPGNHHSGEVINGKWYVFGGFKGGSEGTVQIYDFALDKWTVDSQPMPWAGGSVNSAVVNGKVIVSGGIVGRVTVPTCGIYDPAAPEGMRWKACADMLVGANHAAAGGDGKLFWVFGGRSGRNIPSNGFGHTQIYDIEKDIWSFASPMQFERGGTGKALYHNGEFYIFGGETESGAGAVEGNVYDRVDIYRPSSDSWREGVSMPTPRHGIQPVFHEGKIYVIGGGIVAGYSFSDACEVFSAISAN